MEFCEKCGRIIAISKGKAACVGCGYKPKKKFKIEVGEKMTNKETVAVINEKSENVYPITQIDCPKCKNKNAYFWTTQTRSSDEAETSFYKCTKCNYSWRKYR